MHPVSHRLLLDQIFDEWQLSAADRRLLHDLGEAAYPDVCAIHTTLMNLFPHNPMLAVYWPTTPNRAFDNRSPIDLVRQQGLDGLKEVRMFIDPKH